MVTLTRQASWFTRSHSAGFKDYGLKYSCIILVESRNEAGGKSDWEAQAERSELVRPRQSLVVHRDVEGHSAVVEL